VPQLIAHRIRVADLEVAEEALDRVAAGHLFTAQTDGAGIAGVRLQLVEGDQRAIRAVREKYDDLFQNRRDARPLFDLPKIVQITSRQLDPHASPDIAAEQAQPGPTRQALVGYPKFIDCIFGRKLGSGGFLWHGRSRTLSAWWWLFDTSP